jgi:hypothetical protein
MKDRTRAALVFKRIATPEPGALAFMMDREGSDAVGHHWPPHVMIFLARTDSTAWDTGLQRQRFDIGAPAARVVE